MSFQTNLNVISIIKGLIKQRKCRLSCSGESMMPLYQPGEIVNIIPIESDIKIGEIVLYYTKEKTGYFLVLHRIHYIAKEYVVVKGDNNYAFDIPIKKCCILGKTASKCNVQIDTVRAKKFFDDYKKEKIDEKKEERIICTT